VGEVNGKDSGGGGGRSNCERSARTVGGWLSAISFRRTGGDRFFGHPKPIARKWFIVIEIDEILEGRERTGRGYKLCPERAGWASLPRRGDGACYDGLIFPICVTFRNICHIALRWRRPVSGAPLGWQGRCLFLALLRRVGLRRNEIFCCQGAVPGFLGQESARVNGRGIAPTGIA